MFEIIGAVDVIATVISTVVKNTRNVIKNKTATALDQRINAIADLFSNLLN